MEREDDDGGRVQGYLRLDIAASFYLSSITDMKKKGIQTQCILTNQKLPSNSSLPTHLAWEIEENCSVVVN